MEKLEIKHISPYLPYNLCFITPLQIIGFDKVLPKQLHGIIDNYARFNTPDGYIEYYFEDIKPILRPFSDLTKPCLPGGLIPMFELIKMCDLNTTDFELHFINLNFCLYSKSQKRFFINDNNFYLTQKLFEYHFDIFGLIENGLAIDINTLSK